MEKPKARIEVIKVRKGDTFDLDWNDTVVSATEVVGGIYDDEADECVDGHNVTIVRRG